MKRLSVILLLGVLCLPSLGERRRSRRSHGQLYFQSGVSYVSSSQEPNATMNLNVGVPISRRFLLNFSGDFNMSETGYGAVVAGPSYVYRRRNVFAAIGIVGGAMNDSNGSTALAMGGTASVGINLYRGFHVFVSPQMLTTLQGANSETATFLRGGLGIMF